GPRMLVARDVADSDELLVEPPRLRRRRPAPVRLQSELVLLLPRDAVALGDVLAGLAHRLERKELLHLRVREPPPEMRVVGHLVAARERLVRLREHERRTRHRLDAAGDEEVAVAAHHCMTRADDRAQTRRAQPVDRHARDRLRETREERGHARDVAVVLPRLVRAAEPDVLDLVGGDAAPLDDLAHDERGEIVGTYVRERPAVAPDRRANAGEDDGPRHSTHSTGIAPPCARASSSRTAWRPSSP